MVHENPQIGSDGESEEGSRHSDTAAVSAQSASSAAAGGGGATGTSSSSDLYSSRGAGGGSGEGKVSFSGKKLLLGLELRLHNESID